MTKKSIIVGIVVIVLVVVVVIVMSKQNSAVPTGNGAAGSTMLTGTDNGQSPSENASK